MKLLTKAIIDKLPPLYSTEDVPTDQKRVVVKFFTPDANWTWYIVEGERQEDGDWLFFGLVDGLEREWGYCTLSQLQEVRGAFGLPVERDRFFDGKVPT